MRVHLEDGSTNEIEIGSQSFVAVGETIAALRPELLEAVDAKGKVLRAVRPAEQPDEDDSPTATAPSSASLGVPSTADAETQRFALFARLLSEAYRHSNEVIFARMVDLFDAVNQRSEASERASTALYKAQVKALEDQIRALGEQPETSGDMLQDLLSTFLGGARAASSPTPPNGHANGAANGAKD